jgi:hypothetical protein
MAGIFFSTLDKVMWTRGTGGYVIYSDEYLRESEDFGSGKRIVDPLGPIGTAEVTARGRALGAYFSQNRSRVSKRKAS